MKIKTLVVDDDKNWRTIISKFVNMIPQLENVGTCESAVEGYAKIIENDIDLLICDIEMPEMSGIDLVKSLRNPPLIIFVTSHRDYALNCYDVSPVDFLLKPLELDRFIKSIEKVKDRFENPINPTSVSPYLFVRENQTYIQITYKNILYMKAQENYVQIVTNERTFLPILTITKLENQLKGDTFLRVHRSYIVNRAAISTITKDDIVLVSGQKIPIGDQYRDSINRKHIDEHHITRSN